MAPVIAESTSTTRVCSRSILVSELSAWDADKMPSRSIVPVVTVERCGRTSADWSWPSREVVVGFWSQGRVGPVQLVDLRGRAPGDVLVAGLGEQGIAGVLDAVGEVEAGRAFGDQRPMPGPLTPGGLAAGGVEGQDGGAEVADRPGPFGLEQPQQMPEVVRRVRGPGGQPPRHARPARPAEPPRSSPPAARACPASASPRSRRATAGG